MNKRPIFLLISILATFSVSLAQQLEWAGQFETTSNSFVDDVATDNLGYLYVLGDFSANSTMDVDPGPGVHLLNGQSDGTFFLVKIDPFGNMVWARSFPGEFYFRGQLLIESNGNIIFASAFLDTIDADPGPGSFPLISNGSSDIVVIKLDGAGNLMWAKSIGASNEENSFHLDLGTDNNYYITGHFSDSVDFDPGPAVFNLNESGFSYAPFLLSLDNNGNFRFAVKLAEGGSGTTINCYNDGTLIATGGFVIASDFDPGPGSVNLDPFNGMGYLCKYDSSGSFIWAKQIGRAASDAVFDSQFNLILAGQYNDTLDFNPGPDTTTLNYEGESDLFLLKLDAGGDFLWAHGFTNTDFIQYPKIAVDSQDQIYLHGVYNGTIDMDPGPGYYYLDEINSESVLWENGRFISRFSMDGDLLNVLQWKLFSNSLYHHMAVDQTGNIYYGGNLGDNLDIDPGPNFEFHNSGEYVEGFILKLNPDTCENLIAAFDSLTNISCSLPGLVYAHAEGGLPGYSYSWNTTPPLFDSTLIAFSPGIYTLTITDTTGCTSYGSIIQQGPIFGNQLDIGIEGIVGVPVPGQDFNLVLNAFNNGCLPGSNMFTLILDSNVTFVSSTPVPGLISGDTLYWWYNNLSYYSSSMEINLILNTDTILTSGDELCFEAMILPISGDADTSNNNWNSCRQVVTAYDPNDKQVNPGGACDDHYVLRNEKLTYTIRFQNTGDTTSFNVIIVDELDPWIDLNSIHVVASSHPLITEILPGPKLKFRFDNINLPDSSEDFNGSMGFIVYEANTDSLVPDGTLVKNKAFILFDFNYPIETNEVSNTIVNFIPLPDTSIVVNGITLSAAPGAASYQWINCATGQNIPGANSPIYVPVNNGIYAVQIISNSCTALSSCYSITGVGIKDDYLDFPMMLYPNPAKDFVDLVVGGNDYHVKTELYATGNNLVATGESIGRNTWRFNLSPLQGGVYHVRVTCTEGSSVRKLVIIR